jgi:MFS family permease
MTISDKEMKTYKNRWWAFLVLALAILIVVIDHTILNVALPTMQTALGASVSQLQWIIDAYVLAFAPCF